MRELEAILSAPGGATYEQIQEALGVDRLTIRRYIAALQRAGVRIDHEEGVTPKRWFVEFAHARRTAIPFTQMELVMLLVSRRASGFLRGTGFVEAFDQVFQKIEATLQRKDVVAVRNIGRKVHDLNEEAYFFDDRDEHVDAVITGLLYGERLEVRHESHRKGAESFTVDPYTLAIYRKGLYLVGFSHPQKEIRTFALDRFHDVDRRPKDRFEYPESYDPAAYFKDVYGITGGGGPKTKKDGTTEGVPELVRILFDTDVAHYVRRRCWHPSQTFVERDGGLEMHLHVCADKVRGRELRNLVMRFGRTAEVLEPASLRQEVEAELAAALAKYSRTATAR